MFLNILLSIFFVLATHTYSAHAAVIGEIVGQGGQKFPIAVSPLKILGAMPSDAARLSTGIADAMVHDLELSGWLDRKSVV